MDGDETTRWALFRWAVISPLVCRRLETPEERQELRQAILNTIWLWPDGSERRIGERTLRSWLAGYRQRGFEGMRNKTRSTRGVCRAISVPLLDRAEALRREMPTRSVRTILVLLEAEGFDALGLSESTLCRQLNKRGAAKHVLIHGDGSYQRFEHRKVNDVWQCDTHHGVWLQDPNNPRRVRRTKLIGFIDDASRVITHAQFYWHEQLPDLIDCFRKALLKRGKPRKLLLDNAWIFHSVTLESMCGELGIELKFCKRKKPTTKGKIERWIGTLKSAFETEAAKSDADGVEKLNAFFFGWLTKYYHHHVHSELKGLTPLERWRQDQDSVERVTPESIRRALMIRATRRVHTRTATISLESRTYQASKHMAGKTVQVRWHASDLSEIQVWLDGKQVETARLVVPGPEIDWSRHSSVQAQNDSRSPLASSRRLRLSLSGSSRPEAAAPLSPELLSQDEFMSLMSSALERVPADEENLLLVRFFSEHAPLGKRLMSDALEQAVSAKGKNMHLRFYCQHIEDCLNSHRR